VPDESQGHTVAREVFIASLFGGRGAPISAWAHRRVAAMMTDLYLRAGETLYSEGETAEAQYFVVSGEVTALDRGEPRWTYGPRATLGALDVALERPRARTAVAKTDAHLLRFDREEWLDLLEDDFTLARRFLRNVATNVLKAKYERPPAPHAAKGASLEEPADPPRSQQGMNLVERILLFHDVPFLRRARIQTLTSLAGMANEVFLARGQLAFGRDARGEAFYVVASGEVETSREKPERVEWYPPRSVIGGPAAFLSLAPYEARATSATRVLCFRSEDYFDLMEEHFDLARSALVYLAAESSALMESSVSAAV
jgi:CRP-like cAMP-binding protein